MRIVEVEEEYSRGQWILWLLGGAAVGLSVGVLLSEKLSGRDGGVRTVWRRARSLARIAGGQWMPLLGLLMELRERWAKRGADDDAESDLLDEEYEETSGEFEAADADDDPDDDSDDDADDDSEDDSDDDAAGADPIGKRVLEAFRNDPILARRAIEIDGDDTGAVFLHGRVWTAREVSHAVTLAGGVPGVTGVRQRIRVRDRR